MWACNALKNGLLSDPFQEMSLNWIQAKTALAQMNVKWKSAGEKLNLKSENKDYDWSFDLLLIYWSDIDLILIWYWSWYWSILIGNVRFFFQSLILKNLYSWYWKKNMFNIIDQDWSGLFFFTIGSSGVSTFFSTKSPQSRVFFECVCMFLQWFPSRHSNLHICRRKAVPKYHV